METQYKTDTIMNANSSKNLKFTINKFNLKNMN